MQELGSIESYAGVIPGVMEMQDDIIQAACDQLVQLAQCDLPFAAGGSVC